MLGYRRFFDVDTLIAIRVELDDVFDATHALLLDLYADGVVDGFRIDHPDGLADPEGYLERLRDATGGAWVVVEKILEGGERLPAAWPCAGTTGYDAIRVDPGRARAARPAPTRRALARPRRRAVARAVEIAAKRQVVRDLLRPEVGGSPAAPPALSSAGGALADPDVAREALRELLVARRGLPRLPATGSIRPTPARARAARARCRAARHDAARPRRRARRARAAARRRRRRDDAAGRDLVVRFQQVCGPVMAKGVEDTTFYRWHRLIALERGRRRPGARSTRPTPSALHAWARTSRPAATRTA